MIEQYVDLRSKCEILSCDMHMVEGSLVDVDARDDPGRHEWCGAAGERGVCARGQDGQRRVRC